MMSVHCIIPGGEYAAELSKDKKRAVQWKASMLVVQKGGVFKMTWQSCEGLGLKLQCMTSTMRKSSHACYLCLRFTTRDNGP